MNREDPKERYAGQEPVTIGGDAAEGASILSPDVEAEIETATREEMRVHDEEKARALENARLAAAGIPVLPPTPPANADPYTLMLLQGMQATQQALLQFINAQNEGKSVPYHLIKHDTPWNPSGKRDRVKLTRPTFISGYPVNPMVHTEEEIELLNKLKPGRYNGRKWEVVKFQDGSVDIRFPNRTIEQRMDMALKAPTLATLCKVIIAEREQQESRRAAGVFPDDDE